jgi:hypothetical protein
MGYGKFNYWMIGLTVAIICGCTSTKHIADGPHAVINDVAVPGGAPYKIVAVDGNPVERCQHWIHTVVPYVVVAPGTHTLSLDVYPGKDLQPATVVGSFEAGKRYRLEVGGRGPAVVEDSR